jgi:uncharacterized protein (TIGR02996 family)
MPSEADFLRAIIADPDADGPRLVYADWREQCGDSARAEFVRTQCALTALPEEERERHPLREREKELLRRQSTKWFQPFIELLGRPARRLMSGWFWQATPRPLPPQGQFRRGFVEELTVELLDYLDHASTLAQITPLSSLVGRWFQTDRADLWQRLAQCPQTARLTSLALACDEAGWDNGLVTLIASPHLKALTAFALDARLGSAGIDVLAGSDFLGRLQRLDLNLQAKPDDRPRDVAALFQSPAAERLVSVSVTSAGMMGEQLRSFVSFPHSPSLTRLNLSHNPLGDRVFDGIPELLPATLTVLDLSATYIGDRAAAALAASESTRRLRHLDLSRNVITDVGAMFLADSPNLLGSTHLDLRLNPISPRVKEALRIRCGHHVLV